MPTIQVRNVPADVHETFQRRAAAAGMSLQEYLLAELVDVGRRRSLDDVLAEVEAEISAEPARFSAVSALDIIRADRERV
jgi:plasmid stability protein